jgi:E3 ubiquitin-protein ligase RNF14
MSQVLNSKEFDRWERLLLQRTFDSMDDIMYCPKCQNPIIVDEFDNHAYCFVCRCDFCKLCKENFHAVIINGFFNYKKSILEFQIIYLKLGKM